MTKLTEEQKESVADQIWDSCIAQNDDRYDITQRLIKEGADVNGRAQGQSFPLAMIAFFSNCPKIFRLLLENGADIYQADIDGDTVYELIKERENENIVYRDIILEVHPELKYKERHKKQIAYCNKNGLPVFAAERCYSCGKEIYERYTDEAASSTLITGCPHCFTSFV